MSISQVSKRAILVVASLGSVVGCGDDADSDAGTGASTGTAIDADSGGADSSSQDAGSTTSAPTSDTTGEPDPTTGGSEETGEPDGPRPPKPAGLINYVTGNDEDADVTPTGPGLVLNGGNFDVDEGFVWWGDYIAGGDVVVIRISGSDGYNDYLYGFGNADSVETMIVTADFADDPYVLWTLRHAEAIFMAGGDQADYLQAWKGAGVEEAMHHAWDRGAVLGGISAGLAVIGEHVFAAYQGTVYSDEALADPYNQYMELERDFLALPMLAGVVTDSHFAERDRMGRLLAFLARIHADGWGSAAIGLGIDEDTALVVDPAGQGTVLGEGSVYVVKADDPPQVCMAGVPLEYADLRVHALVAGDTVTFPGAETKVAPQLVSASGGVTMPADPY